jgi:hypothetical protein
MKLTYKKGNMFQSIGFNDVFVIMGDHSYGLHSNYYYDECTIILDVPSWMAAHNSFHQYTNIFVEDDDIGDEHV